VSFQSRADAVTHSANVKLLCVCVSSDEPKSISTVRGINGTSRENGRPCGVIDPFQVSEYSVEPSLANRCRNLFSHDNNGPSCGDESKEVGP
jgi:hypothetical protein